MSTTPALDDPFLLALGRRLDVCRQALLDSEKQESRFSDVLKKNRLQKTHWLKEFTNDFLTPFNEEKMSLLCSRLQDNSFTPEKINEEIKATSRAAFAALRALQADGVAENAASELLRVNAEIDDVRNNGAALQVQVQRLSDEETFQELIEVSFDKEWGPRWWTLSYHRFKKNADVLVQRFGLSRGLYSFTELLQQHKIECAALETLEENLRQNEALRQRLLDWLTEEKDALFAIENAEWVVMKKCGERIFEILTSQNPEIILDFSEQDSLAEIQRRYWGMRARLRYLEAAHEQLIEKTQKKLHALMHDLETKRAHPEILNREALPHFSKVDEDTALLKAQYIERTRLYGLTLQMLDAFSDFEKCTPVDDMTWWDFICAGLDGSYIDEVAMKRALRGTARSLSKEQAWLAAEKNAARRLEDALAIEDKITIGDGEEMA